MAIPTDISASVTTRAAARPTDWTSFTGQMLAVVGALNIAYGVAGIVNGQTVPVVGAEGRVVDLAVWGWVLLGIGVAVAVVGLASLAGRQWSPRIAIGLVVVSAMVQVALIHAYPLWALAMIMLDLVIIDQLVTRWEDS